MHSTFTIVITLTMVVYRACACLSKYSPGEHLVNITVGSSNREAILYVPEHASTNKSLPLLVDLHGYSSNPFYVSLVQNVTLYSNPKDWLLVLPYGTARTPTTTCCPSSATETECRTGQVLDKFNPCAWNAGSCCGSAASEDVADTAFIKALVHHLTESACADESNVFAVGFSNGAMMANRLGCELSDIFKAIVPHSGNIEVSPCTPNSSALPTSWLSFCGTEDSVCRYDFEQTALTWKDLNGCTGSAKASFQSATTNCTAWTGCGHSEAFVEMCWIADMRHCWSGNERPSTAGGESLCEQPSTNIHATSYLFQRLATLVE